MPDPRIVRLARRDRQIAIAAIVALWALFGFVFVRLIDFGFDTYPGVVIIVGITGAAVLLLNAAAIFVLIRRLLRPAEMARIFEPELFHAQQSEAFRHSVARRRE